MLKTILAMTLFLLAACAASPPPAPEPPPAELARATHDIATESFHAGRYREAYGLFREAEVRFTSIDDARGVASAAISQAEISLLLGDIDSAQAPLQRARAASERVQDKELRERVRLLEARRLLDTASARGLLETLRSATSPVAAHAALLLCELEVENGAHDCIESLQADNDLLNARIDMLSARAALAKNDLERARTRVAMAAEVFRALAWRPGLAASHELSAQIAFKRGDSGKGHDHLVRALYVRLWMEDRVRSASLLEQLAATEENDKLKDRYREWQQVLLEGEPDWQEMIEEVFNLPPALPSAPPRQQTAPPVPPE